MFFGCCSIIHIMIIINLYCSGIQCPNRPSAPEDGNIHSDAIDKTAYEFEDTVTYSCNAGFELIGEATLTCLSDGTWDRTPPTCQSMYYSYCLCKICC